MNFKRLIPFVVVMLIAITGCKKSTTPRPTTKTTPPEHTGPDVYVVGYEETADSRPVATYWKNGIANHLADSTSNSIASKIAISAGNIYIAGILDGVTTYWKNGVATKLPNIPSFTSFALSGNDIYFAGNTTVYYDNGQNAHSVATYWKNDSLHYLENVANNSESSFANAITVQGSNIYVAGYIGKYNGPEQDPGNFAVWWKNGARTIAADSGSTAIGITVNGDDVYIAGSISAITLPISQYSFASITQAYWKNGIINHLNNDGLIRAVAVNGNSIYLIGSDYKNSLPAPFYWTNGAYTHLTNTFQADGAATAIALYGSDVYVTALIENSSASVKPYGAAIYWKNGIPVELSKKNAAANDIAVVSN